MYADVVVLTYQSPDIDSYTYEVPKELEATIKIGQLVEVPFGKRWPRGIVIAVSKQILKQVQDDKSVVIKQISKILLTSPLLLSYQIELLKWMSFYYIAPMVNCLEAILPELPRKQLSVHSSQYEKIQSVNRQPPASLRGRSGSTVNQTLILVPSINQIPETLAKFPKAKNYAVYHNELAHAEKFSTWLKILSGQVDYVFGSRSAIFAPCPNLGDIIIYNEHDGTYKDEHSPYFDTLTVGQKISHLTGAQIKIVDPAPKITTYFQLKNNIKMQKFNIATKIIPMQEERLSGNFSPLSTFVQLEILKKQKQNILLFLNKKKESGAMYCKNCNFNDYFENRPVICPKCKSPDFYFNVLNINSLEDEVNRITHLSPLTSHLSIDIQTASIFYAQLVNKYDLAVYIQPDSLLNRADFTSTEHLYSNSVNLKKLLKENGTLIIQTYNPSDPTIIAIKNNDFELLYKNQLEGRRLLSYPPFSLLVKIIIKGKNQQKIELAAHQLIDKLKSTIRPALLASLRSGPSGRLSNYPTIQILGPFKPVFFYKFAQFNIIIKYKLDSYTLKDREKAIKTLTHLRKLKDCQIVVEPESMN